MLSALAAAAAAVVAVKTVLLQLHDPVVLAALVQNLLVVGFQLLK
jgi:hypothetical protein